MTTINHDSGGTPGDHWTTVTDTSARLSVTGSAALNSSTNGLQIDYSATNAATVEEPITLGDTLSFVFYFDPNSAQTPTSDARVICQTGINTGGLFGSYLAAIIITKQTDGVIAWSFSIRDDTGPSTPLSGTLTDASHKFEVLMTRASSDVASDGTYELLIDESSEGSASGIDNYDVWATMDEVLFSSAAWEAAMSSTVVYFDEVSVSEIASNAFRFLGLAADTEQLYITGLKDGATLQLYTYSDLDSLTEGGTIHAFGSATDSDIDSLAKGIYPVARPGADLVVYVRGRDGNDVHVQKNDLNGVAGWQDLDDGGWAASKVAVALMPDILNPDDLIVAFGDDDIYRSQDDGANWVKMGDAPTTLRGGARHPLTDNELLLAGTTSGDPHYTHNFGVSFAGATDDDIIQTEEVRVAAGADDGYVDQGVSTFNDSLVNFSFGQISGNDVDAWVRFDGVAVPQGATITAAYIEFVSDSNRTGAMTVDIYGEDADDPAAPSSVADYNARARTTATINWDPGDWTDGEIYQTDDIKTIIQEIVDRVGWASGNAMQIFIERSTGTVRRVATAYEGSAGEAALLHIEYQVTGLINAIEYSL